MYPKQGEHHEDADTVGDLIEMHEKVTQVCIADN